jgi:hypothetical protein
MGHIRPISDDKWESWEPLVAGLPLFLRLILLQYGVLILVFGLLQAASAKQFLEAPPQIPSEGLLGVFRGLVLVWVLGWIVWDWLQCFRAKRSAIANLGIFSVMLSVGSVVLLLLLLPAPVKKPFPHWPFVVLAAAASLGALEAVYLFRLRAKLKRLGLP